MPFKAGSFSLLCDRACFHYISNQNRQQYANEVYRVLEPGGSPNPKGKQ